MLDTFERKVATTTTTAAAAAAFSLMKGSPKTKQAARKAEARAEEVVSPSALTLRKGIC